MDKKTLIGIAVVIAFVCGGGGFVLLAASVVVNSALGTLSILGDNSNDGSCLPKGPDGLPALAGVAGAGGGGDTLDSLNESQLGVARDIVGVGEKMRISAKGQTVALSTAIQESRLRRLSNPNVPGSDGFPNEGSGTDHLSVGPFQQQPWWGTLEELMSSVHSARIFYEALLRVPGWEQMPVTVAAQTVQVSAFPDAYAPWETLSTQLQQKFAGAGSDIGDIGPVTNIVLAAHDTELSSLACDNALGNDGRPTFDPGGPFGPNVVSGSMEWLGMPYIWGGGNQTGPTGTYEGTSEPVGFDCSGLTKYAVAKASGGKIILDHYTGGPNSKGQLNDPRGQVIALADAKPGDIVFFTSSPGEDAHHVGVYAGDGKMVHAPTFGQVVHVAPLLQGEQIDVRRFG